ncbi:MAG: penicillin-binding transpeptidase domain-containing protein [Clostridia bacterium]|nr:penicillin-binding transpeptidase domain-containing protein [Clostridia bacterium]HPB16267.1 penicillin-binding transpeptidase domain-containing protein [Clostridia bacterium]HQM95655.1 penicillin-binding transpeptidase domain-containing protein [Clostridia bacterium]
MDKKEKSKKTENIENTTNNTLTRKRLLILMAVFIFIAMIIAGYTGYIQFVWANELKVKSYEQQNQDRTIKASRGTIYDSQGRILAISISVDTISASPVILQKNKNITVEEIAQELCLILKLNYESVLTKLMSQSQYQLIASKVDKNTSELVKEFIKKQAVAGIYIQQDSKRYYPFGSLAAHAIGFTGDDNQGLFGLELALDEYLSGTDGKILTELDVGGTELPFAFESRIEAVDGYDVITTLNADIQRIAENIVKQAIEDNKSKDGAVCIISNSKTSEILAMVSEPGFDLNLPRVLPKGYTIDGWTGLRNTDVELLYSTVWRNKAIMDTYEPGSTFKSITTAMALEEDIVELDTIVDDLPVTVFGAVIHCWSKEYPHGTETFLQAVYNSCNPVFVKISHLIGVKTFYEYVESFGFRDNSGIELQGEGKSIFHDVPTKLDMSVASFGQRFQITPIQMVAAYNAIANGGFLIKPSLTDAIVDKQGNVIYDYEPQTVRQVISKETSDELRGILEGVVTEGGAKNAYVEGYRVAGKTGTSETIVDDVYVSSFIGFAPADNPVITVLFIVFNPQGDSYYGSQVAAPYAKMVFEQALEVLSVERQGSAGNSKNSVYVPNLNGYNVEKAAQKIVSYGLNYEIEGSTAGEDVTIMYQYPESGTKIAKDGVIILYTYVPDSKMTVRIPYLVGKEKSYVIKTLKDLGLNINSDGDGSCISVQYPAGTYVEKGTIVDITFRFTDYLD